MRAIYSPAVFDGEHEHAEAVVLIEGDRIVGLAAEAPPGFELEELPEGAILAPGFIDLQVNGGGGVLLNHRIDVAAMTAMAAAHARAGSTTILPTVISGTRPELHAALQAARVALAQGVPGVGGLHLEGPFLAPSRRGIHPADHIASPDAADIAMLTAGFPGPLLLTVAPDVMPPAMVRQLVKAGVIVFAGHTDADYATVLAGFDAGIVGFTHLYSAMSQLTPRAPGALGAALADPRPVAGIIVDGLHVHPAAIRIAFNAMGPERLFLVSDAMATAASDLERFMLYDVEITLRDGKLADAAGTLAGAHLTLAEAVANMVHLVGCSRHDALRMATATPADVAGFSDRGRIAPGLRADLVALNHKLEVIDVWQGGRRL